MTKAKQADQYFHMATIAGGDLHKIDKVNNIIRGAKIAQLGAVGDDRPWHADEATLSTVAELGNQPAKGLKARFSHPEPGQSGMGRFVGRWRNFEVNDGAVYADLHLSQAAFNSPGLGDIGNYLFTLAADAPEAFGVSLHARVDQDATFEADGALRFSGLKAADFVDDPALTSGGLFEYQHQSIEAGAETFDNGGHEMAKEIDDVVDVVETPEPVEAVFDLAQAGQEAKPFIDAFGAEGAQAFLSGQTLLECYQAHVAVLADQVKARDESLAALSKELADLKAFAANDGEDEPLSSAPAVETSKASQFANEQMAKGVAPLTAKLMGGMYGEKE